MDEHFGLTANVASDILKKQLCTLLRDPATRAGICQRVHNAVVQFPQLLDKSSTIQKNLFQAAELLHSMLTKWKPHTWQLFAHEGADAANHLPTYAQHAGLLLLLFQLTLHRAHFSAKQQPCLLEWQTAALSHLDGVVAGGSKGHDAAGYAQHLLSQLRGDFFARKPFKAFHLAPFTIPPSAAASSAPPPSPSQFPLLTGGLLTTLPRTPCPSCGACQSFYCSACLLVVHPLARSALPRVPLPLEVGIILHANVPRAKSTALQAVLLGFPRERASVYTWPQVDPQHLNPEDTVVVFPSDFEDKKAVTIEQLAAQLRARQGDAATAAAASIDAADSPPTAAFPLRSLRRVVFLEGTWEEAGVMARDHRLRSLVHVRLHFDGSGSGQPSTAFWRFQRLGSAFLSSIEAVHATLTQLDAAGLLGDSRDDEGTGVTPASSASSSSSSAPHQRFDNLLWLFALTYERVLAYYRSHPQLQPAL